MARCRGLWGIETISLRRTVGLIVVGSIGLSGVRVVVVVRGESCILGGRGMLRGWRVGMVQIVRPGVPMGVLVAMVVVVR